MSTDGKACWCGTTEDVRRVQLTIAGKDARSFGIPGELTPSRDVVVSTVHWCRGCRERAGIIELIPRLVDPGERRICACGARSLDSADHVLQQGGRSHSVKECVLCSGLTALVHTKPCGCMPGACVHQPLA